MNLDLILDRLIKLPILYLRVMIWIEVEVWKLCRKAILKASMIEKIDHYRDIDLTELAETWKQRPRLENWE